MLVINLLEGREVKKSSV